ncbi:GNAT family N-acetyltransferase [Rhabdochromatium marinum]|uniref:GNAT family N-acetyltransferase n=1 Tax=Rhabdochromatium marinum TaxID=48729 RepID=UPI001F5BF7EC|nr:GNAT family N-acetyltransferase [Rhabdochromatium marinum]
MMAQEDPHISSITIAPITGPELLAKLPAVAALRIEVFREYPYLYDGDLEYETRYLRTYAEHLDSVIVLAMDGDQVIGASTAVPMRHAGADICDPFRAYGIDPERVFYLGESIILPPYRGRGIGARFFEERERHAERLGGFDYHAFCAVERPRDDPRIPINYRYLHNFWNRCGYHRVPGLYTSFSWREIGEIQESPKPMVFWLKPMTDEARATL